MTSYMSLKSLLQEGSGQDRTWLNMKTFEHKTNTLINIYKKQTRISQNNYNLVNQN